MNKELRKFGFSLGLALNVLGCIMFYRHKAGFIWFTYIGSAAFMAAVLRPAILAPLKKLIDKFIFLIGWVIGAVSLLIVFYLIFTPTALLFKLFGNDLLNNRLDRKIKSYWIERKRNAFSKKYYEQMG